MKQTSKRFLSMILEVIFLVGSVGIYFQLIRPAYSNISALRAEEFSLRSFFDAEKAAVRKVTDLINNYKKENQQIQETASLVLPMTPDVAGALAQLYGLTTLNDLVLQDVGMSVSGLSNAPVKGLQPENLESALQRPIGTVSFNLRLNGSYNDFKRFLGQAQTNMRAFDVKTVAMNPVVKIVAPGARAQAVLPGTERYDFNVVIAAYYQSQ